MTIQWLIQWWNLIFVLPMGLALMYLGLMTFSGVTFGDADADHDFDADHDLDADHDVEADADSDADADGDAETDGDTDADHDAEAEDASESEVSLAMSALSLARRRARAAQHIAHGRIAHLGLGRIDLHALLEDRGAAAAWISIPVAAVFSMLVAHFVAVFIAHYFPLNGTSAQRRHALLGLSGQAMLPIDGKFGMVSVRDATGDLYQVACRAAASDESINKGEPVRLVAYNASRQMFLVERETAPAGK